MKVGKLKFDKFGSYINNKGAGLVFSERHFFLLRFRQCLSLLYRKLRKKKELLLKTKKIVRLGCRSLEPKGSVAGRYKFS